MASWSGRSQVLCHALDLSYSPTRNCGALRKLLSFSEPLLAGVMEYPPTGLLCRLRRHMSLAQCLAYGQCSPDGSHLYCLVWLSLSHTLTYTTHVVKITAYSHNRVVTLTHEAKLTGRNWHFLAVAVNLSRSFRMIHASLYPNISALSSHSCRNFLDGKGGWRVSQSTG